MIRLRVVLLFFIVLPLVSESQQTGRIVVTIDPAITYQTIDNFGGSDAWACQFVGNWPEPKKNAMADWLFSLDTLGNGDPKGIGLSIWRYNLGAGSAEQAAASGIRDEWRRAPLTLGRDRKVDGQNWFLRAARQRGVKQFLAFYNSPPVTFTKNGRAFADSGRCNLDPANNTALAKYTIQALKEVSKVTGVTFDYLSPVNEPQWDWSDGGQEGCPYDNAEISSLVKALDKGFREEGIMTKLIIPESGQINYLVTAADRQHKDQQLTDFFSPASPLFVGNLQGVAPVIAAHSYFTTSPFRKGADLRIRINDSTRQVPGLKFWQSEYCILGDNGGEINGNKKDLGITAALYLAKVVHQDLTYANATAWQWWTAISAYDYKDGLVYIDKEKEDGNFSDSKMMWALGNFSRFIRPGMKRVAVKSPEVKGLYFSAFTDLEKKSLVTVMINESKEKYELEISENQHRGIPVLYITDASRNLARQLVTGKMLTIPPGSIVTAIYR